MSDSSKPPTKASKLRSIQLPKGAKHRIEQLRHALEAGGATFTNLTPQATLAALAEGIEPMGVVLGTSVYMNSPPMNFFVNWGLTSAARACDEYVDGMLAMRRRAIERLRAEAYALGADGVIGVDVGTRDVGETGAIEYKLVGTAVRVLDKPLSDTKRPFTSDLTGTELQKLRQAGGWPIDVVYGVGAHWVHMDIKSRFLSNFSWRNVEITLLSQGYYAARQKAMKSMRADAKRHGATHVVGASFGVQVVPVIRFGGLLTDYLVVYFARGTAINESEAPATSTTRKPLMMLDLATGKQAAITRDGIY